MASKSEPSERKTPARKKSSSNGGAKSILRSVVGTGVAGDTLLDLVERLGLVDIVLGRVKSRIDETDIDELLDEATDYLRRNPEVLVVSLGAVTVATGLLVWLNNRREWDGAERRRTAASSSRAAAAVASPGRVRRTTSASRSEQ
jgi:hypothetical protein